MGETHWKCQEQASEISHRRCGKTTPKTCTSGARIWSRILGHWGQILRSDFCSFFFQGNPTGGLAKGAWPERRQLGQKGPFWAISVLPLSLWGVEELVPISPEKAMERPQSGLKRPRFSRAEFPRFSLKIWGLSPRLWRPIQTFPSFFRVWDAPSHPQKSHLPSFTPKIESKARAEKFTGTSVSLSLSLCFSVSLSLVCLSVSLSLCLSVSLSLCLSVSLSLCLSISLSLSLSLSLCLSVSLSLCLSVSLSLCLPLSLHLSVSVSLSLYLSVSLSLCLLSLYLYLAISLSLCLSVSLCLSLSRQTIWKIFSERRCLLSLSMSLSVSLSLFLSVSLCLSVSLSLCLSVSLSLCLSVSLSLCLSVSLSLCLSVSLSLCLSVSLSLCLSVSLSLCLSLSSLSLSLSLSVSLVSLSLLSVSLSLCLPVFLSLSLSLSPALSLFSPLCLSRLTRAISFILGSWPPKDQAGSGMILPKNQRRAQQSEICVKFSVFHTVFDVKFWWNFPSHTQTLENVARKISP